MGAEAIPLKLPTKAIEETRQSWFQLLDRCNESHATLAQHIAGGVIKAAGYLHLLDSGKFSLSESWRCSQFRQLNPTYRAGNAAVQHLHEDAYQLLLSNREMNLRVSYVAHRFNMSADCLIDLD